MELTKEQMEQLKKEELEILDAVVEVCDQLHINYFLAQGTLLGAVRHKGFIPWDDDIDIGMLREDFEKFVREGQPLLGTKLFIQTSKTDNQFPHGFGKVRKNDTAFVETTCKNLKMNHGIYIDIFPFDYENRSLLFKIRKFLYRYRIRKELYESNLKVSMLKKYTRDIIVYMSGIIYPSYYKVLQKQYELYKSAKKSPNLVNQGSPWGKRECMSKEIFDELTFVEFEGRQYKAPKKYHEYLSHVYGDYMTLPPVEKRIPHHYISFLSFEKAYVIDDRNIKKKG